MGLDLYYWPMAPGRGEYPRLVLEASGTEYRDVCRLPEGEGGGIAAMTAFLDGSRGTRRPFAPPFVALGDLVVSQSAQCSAFLGERCGLAPEDEADRLFARSIALTMADLVDEVHDVHHPLGSHLYYEDQKAEAQRRAEGFRESRLPKFLDWFENLIGDNPAASGFLVGDRMSYADLGLFQTMAGLHFAFPRRMEALEKRYERIAGLVTLVLMDAKVEAYLASDRRMAFNSDGIFRPYEELDAA